MSTRCGARGCGATTPDLLLCTRHADELRQALLDAPTWLDDLDTVRARLTRYGNPNGGGHSADTPLPYNPAATAPTRRLTTALRHWAGAVGWGIPDSPIAQQARWLANVAFPRLHSHPQADQAHHDIVGALHAAMRAGDAPPPRHYVGPCHCGQHLYTPPNATVTQCPECKTIHSVQRRREWLLRRAANVLVTAVDASRALTDLHHPVTENRIAKWKQAGQLRPKRYTDSGRPLYRLGDITTLVQQEQARRSKP